MLAVLPGKCKGGACPSRARAADRWRLLRLPAGPRHADSVTVSTVCCSTTTKQEEGERPYDRNRHLPACSGERRVGARPLHEALKHAKCIFSAFPGDARDR